MRWIAIALVAASSSALLPAPAGAQATITQGTELEQQMTRRRHVVQPRPDAGAVRRDVDRAEEALAAERRLDEVVRESVSPLRRRPDLDDDVRSGIQSRNLRDALRR